MTEGSGSRMIRQSQNYFAAALSAAVLNAAAIAAFVVFTMLSSAGGFPLQDLLGLGNTVTPASSSSPSGDGEAPLQRSFNARGEFGSPSAVGRSASGDPATATIAQPGTGPRSGGTVPPAGAAPASSGGTSSPGGGSSGGGVGLGAEGPSGPQPSVQSPGGAVSQVPSALNQSVNSAVDAADDVSGGGLSQSGVSQAVQGASNSLLGPGSAVDQAAGGVGSALGASNRIAPEAPVSTPALG